MVARAISNDTDNTQILFLEIYLISPRPLIYHIRIATGINQLLAPLNFSFFHFNPKNSKKKITHTIILVARSSPQYIISLQRLVNKSNLSQCHLLPRSTLKLRLVLRSTLNPYCYLLMRLHTQKICTSGSAAWDISRARTHPEPQQHVPSSPVVNTNYPKL